MAEGLGIQWHLTVQCDQHCKHCYMYDSITYPSELKNELPLPQILRTIDSLYEFTEKKDLEPYFAFSGGDPILRSDLLDILGHCRKRGAKDILILGNPFHLDLPLCKRLKELGVAGYQISIDGLEETHDRFRMPGSFKASLRAIKILQEAGIDTPIMFTLSRENAKDLLGVIRLAHEIGATHFSFARISSVGSGRKNFKANPMGAMEYRRILLRVNLEYERLRRQGTRTDFGNKDHLWVPLFYEMGWLDREGPFVEPRYHRCGMSKGICILADGTAMACRRFHSPLGRFPESSWEEVVDSPEREALTTLDRFAKCRECRFKEVCLGCPAVAFGEHDDPFAPDPQCWVDTGEWLN